MAEVDATIPENSESIAPETQEVVEEPPAPPEPKRGRGRPAGAKDKAPRTAKPRVRAEPIPQPVEPKRAAPKQAPAPAQVHQAVEPESTPVERPPSPEPPSPRKLFRQTSAHLLNLRDVMNSQKRVSAAERYTSRLHAWPVV